MKHEKKAEMWWVTYIVTETEVYLGGKLTLFSELALQMFQNSAQSVMSIGVKKRGPVFSEEEIGSV